MWISIAAFRPGGGKAIQTSRNPGTRIVPLLGLFDQAGLLKHHALYFQPGGYGSFRGLGNPWPVVLHEKGEPKRKQETLGPSFSDCLVRTAVCPLRLLFVPT